MKYNIYCDESCHLKNDGSNAMLLGAIKCPIYEKNHVVQTLRKLKQLYGISTWREIKWTSVSPAKLDFYSEVINSFVQMQDLSFRAVVIQNKALLDHDKFNSSDPDLWYYKAYFYLLDVLIGYGDKHSIFLDIKDTNGGPRARKLAEVLSYNKYDFKGESIEGIHIIRSEESEILQLTDLILGAVSYYHNGRYNAAGSSDAKNALVKKLLDLYGDQIQSGTYRGAKKFDIFLWDLKEGRK